MREKCPLSVHDVQLWLDGVANLDKLIDAKLEERDRIFDLGVKITPDLTGMPHQDGVSDKVGNAAQRLADMAVEMDNLIDKYVNQKQMMAEAFGKLPPKLCCVMNKHYVMHMTWEDIASEMNKSTVTMWRWHLKSLEILQNVMECNAVNEYNSIIE